MTIPRDILLHVAGGCALILWAVIVIVMTAGFGLGPGLATATTLGGIGYELQQRIRKEGAVSWQDAAATAAPGWAAWAALSLL
jgi:hypothetical protein